YGRQAICPGPNIAWFDRSYTLEEMTDHIYGRGASLVPQHRPHMFAKEIIMYVDYLVERITQSAGDDAEMRKLRKFHRNLEAGINECLAIAQTAPFDNENLTSLEAVSLEQKKRMAQLSQFE